MILDTNGLSDFFDGNEGVVSLLGKVDEVYLPIIVIGEYGFGLRNSRLRNQREPALIEFARSCTVLPILESTTLPYATIKHDLKRVSTPIPENDIWIAALALEYSLPILSDDQHFDAVTKVKRVSWR